MRDRPLTVRLPEYLWEMLGGAAELHARKVSAEARVQIELQCHRVLQRQCRMRAPALVERYPPEEEFAAFCREVDAEVAALEVMAHRAPSARELRRDAATTN